MDEIVFVTHNKGKIESAKKHLKDINFQIFEYELNHYFIFIIYRYFKPAY